jgi:erythromycin esterase-like protein
MKEKSNFMQNFHILNNVKSDFDKLMEHIDDGPIVMLGEASHGTQEFYHARAEITKRLITEKGFKSVAIEGDFPDTFRVNRYVNFQSDDESSNQSLGDFKRFPAWMWRNEEMVSFVDWMRQHNKDLSSQERANIFGLDVYSLHKSIAVVIAQLEKIDPEAAKKAKEHYLCFDVYQDPQEYGYYAAMFPDNACRESAIKQLIELRKKDAEFFRYDNLNPEEEKFYIEQNALVIKNAEEYYRSLFGGTNELPWNIRDHHMMETILAIKDYNRATDRSEKIVIWAHNSHLGDSKATQMASYGEINLGHLMKEQYGAQAVSIGFTTYTGTVSAASAWDGEVQRKKVRPAIDGSIESFFHSFALNAFMVIPCNDPDVYAYLNKKHLQRAIGVIYLPESELQSHYFYAQLAEQFDVVIHYDTTNAVIPLEPSTRWQKGEEDAPETFPYGV